jgi:hypothetical protein
MQTSQATKDETNDHLGSHSCCKYLTWHCCGACQVICMLTYLYMYQCVLLHAQNSRQLPTLQSSAGGLLMHLDTLACSY